jgi:hypothetical protein
MPPMRDSDSLNFSNRDLRNRSFRGKNLNGVNFSGSDIRGCDFSRAQLVAANFEHARAGATRRQLVPPILIAGILAIASANGVAQLAFASLGQTPAQPAWFSVVVLHLFAAVAGVGAASRAFLGFHSRAGQIGMYLGGICAAALVTFFYGGSFSGNSSQVAIVGAIVGAGLMAILSLVARRQMSIPSLTMGAVAAYGFSFLSWTVATTCFFTGRYMWGLGLGALSCLYVWFVVCALRTIGYEISHRIGTSFRGADITDAQFDQAHLQQADFSGVLGRGQSLVG